MCHVSCVTVRVYRDGSVAKSRRIPSELLGYELTGRPSAEELGRSRGAARRA